MKYLMVLMMYLMILMMKIMIICIDFMIKYLILCMIFGDKIPDKNFDGGHDGQDNISNIIKG